MEITTTTLGVGIVIALVIVLALWLFSLSSRAGDERREQMKSRYLADQPWDSADGRANR